MNQLLRFTLGARRALQNAQREAVGEDAPEIGMRHLLSGLAQLPVAESTAAHVLNGLGITAHKLAATGHRKNNRRAGQAIEIGAEVKKALERAAHTAQQRGEEGVASAHLLAGALEDRATGDILESAGVSLDRASAALNALSRWTDER